MSEKRLIVYAMAYRRPEWNPSSVCVTADSIMAESQDEINELCAQARIRLESEGYEVVGAFVHAPDVRLAND